MPKGKGSGLSKNYFGVISCQQQSDVNIDNEIMKRRRKVRAIYAINKRLSSLPSHFLHVIQKPGA